MAEDAVRRTARSLAIFAALVLALTPAALVAQTGPEIAGTWQGTWETSKPLRIVLKIAKSGSSDLQAVFYSIDSDMGSHGRTATSIVRQGASFNFAIAPIEGRYEGKLSSDGSSIAGTWTQGGQTHPLNLVRATSETAWAIPEPTRLMPADADPKFDVATIKPSDPNSHTSGIHSMGHHPLFENQRIGDLLAFAYGIHRKQIVDEPGWLWTDHYDIDGVLDIEGQPGLKQIQGIIRKLLADRFQLSFHHEKRELSVYALTVSKDGSKLVKSNGDSNGLPDISGSNNSAGRTLRFTNTSMADLTLQLQFDLDRPVVDQTGLAGRFDSIFRWRNDETPTDDPNAPPGLFTAIQQQLGLKLEPAKALADVLVIDHVERPSSN